MIFGNSPSAGESLTYVLPASYPVAAIVVPASSNIINQNETAVESLENLDLVATAQPTPLPVPTKVYKGKEKDESKESNKPNTATSNNSGALVHNAITLPSEFTTTDILEKPRYAQTITGQHFQIYDLPTEGYNCALFGIYGRRVTRETVIQHLLSASNNSHIRKSMAHDIFSLIMSKEPLPEELAHRRGFFFHILFEEYQKANGSNEAREKIISQLQQEAIFKDYVTYFIGGHVEDNPNGPYNMLTYNSGTDAEIGTTGAMAAIAALNGVSLHIYHEVEQADRSRLLVCRFIYEHEKTDSPVISLLHMSQDPVSKKLNHFQLLASEGIEGANKPKNINKGKDIEVKPSHNSSLFKSNKITPSSIFTYRPSAGFMQATGGSYFQVYDLPTQDYNCSLFGIYGRRVSRAEVVDQLLLAGQSNAEIRRLMALDVLALLWGGEALPQGLEVQQGQNFRQWLAEFEEANASEEARQRLLGRLQEESVFRDYVTYFIGGHVGDIPNNPYNMLTYERNNFNGGGSLGAIAAMNNIALNIYQTFRQADGSSLLVKVFSQPNDQANGRVISLLDMSQDPTNPNNLNHFQLLVLESTEITSGKSQRETTNQEIKTEETVEVTNQQNSPLVHADKSEIVTNNSARLLQFAREGDHAAISTLFTESAVDVNTVNEQGNTALMEAVINGHLESAQVLLGVKGLNINAANNQGCTALMLAAGRPNVQILQDLLNKKNINVNAIDSNSALILAAASEEIENIKHLMEVMETDIRIRNKENQIALGVTKTKNEEIARRLEKDIEQKTNNLKSAIREAAVSSKYEDIAEVVRALFKVPSIDANAVILLPEGTTLLMLTIMSRRLEIVQTLLAVQASQNLKINAIDNQEQTALLMAIDKSKGNDIIQALLNAPKINVNAQDKRGRTALMMAVNSGRVRTARILLSITEININAIDNEGNTTLHHAAILKRKTMIIVLLEAGADINAQNHDGKTALHIAVNQKNSKMVRLLLKYGADRGIQDNENNVAFDLAAMNDDWEIRNILLEWEDSKSWFRCNLL